MSDTTTPQAPACKLIFVPCALDNHGELHSLTEIDGKVYVQLSFDPSEMISYDDPKMGYGLADKYCMDIAANPDHLTYLPIEGEELVKFKMGGTQVQRIYVPC